MTTSVKAKIITEENSQRLDPKWDWHGIRIIGNSQCQGNSNQDLLLGLASEFEIKTLSKIDTYNYYAMFFAFLSKEDIDDIDRDDMMTWLNHARFLQFIITSNKLPVRIVCYTSIGDRLQKVDEQRGMLMRSYDGDGQLLHDIIDLTKRQVSVGTLLSDSGHWIRVHGSDSKKKFFSVNDPFGTHPYKSDAEKKSCMTTYSWKKLTESKIRRIISIEDLV